MRKAWALHLPDLMLVTQNIHNSWPLCISIVGSLHGFCLLGTYGEIWPGWSWILDLLCKLCLYVSEARSNISVKQSYAVKSGLRF